MMASWFMAPRMVPPSPSPPPKSDRMIAASPPSSTAPAFAVSAEPDLSVSTLNREEDPTLRPTPLATTSGSPCPHPPEASLEICPEVPFSAPAETKSSASDVEAFSTSAARISASTSVNSSAVSMASSFPGLVCLLSSSHVNRSPRSFALKNRRCFGSLSTLLVRNSL